MCNRESNKNNEKISDNTNTNQHTVIYYSN